MASISDPNALADSPAIPCMHFGPIWLPFFLPQPRYYWLLTLKSIGWGGAVA